MDLLIKNVYTLLPDHEAKYTDIYIHDGVIVGINEAPETFFADRILNYTYKNMMAVPGFINTHTHAYMSILKNYADDLSFEDWLFGRIMPIEDRLDITDATLGAVIACMEMLKSGITTFSDMHMFPFSSIKAAKKFGMRVVVGRGLARNDEEDKDGQRRIDEAIEEITGYADDPRVSFMIAPHACYSCDTKYLRRLSELAYDLDLGIHTHLSESENEVKNCIQKTGKTPVQLFNAVGLLSNKTVAAHCVHLTDDDIDILKEQKVNVSLNTCSNLKLGNGFAPVQELLDHNINLCLGTDGSASNNALSMLREMQTTALLHKGKYKDPKILNAHQIFDMATINGAKALGLQYKVGKIQEGYEADINLFDLDDAVFTPLGDPYAALAYSAVGVNPHTVICNGEIVIENHEFQITDETAYYNALEFASDKYRKDRIKKNVER